jgi:hypothetical protein
MYTRCVNIMTLTDLQERGVMASGPSGSVEPYLNHNLLRRLSSSQKQADAGSRLAPRHVSLFV